MRIEDNPFEAPRTESLLEPPPAHHFIVADPGKRFIGRFVDNFIFWIMPTMIVLAVEPEDSTLVLYSSMLPMIAIQAFLVASRAQSVGKMLAKTKIVDMEGRDAGFVRGVLLREWVWFFINLVPLVGLIDALFVFRDDHRTLHDLMSGTQVVDVSLAVD